MRELTISTLVRYLKNKLDADINLQKINVIGEISNYHRHYSGHLYFTLKDEHAAINCVMFKSAAFSLQFEPKNGDKVVCIANTSLFEASGQLQLYVLKMNQYGLGDLYARYEKLKKDLTDQGYFDDNHKISIPTQYPDKVAVLVGDKSAAMSDIKRQFTRRWPLCNVNYYPVLVQGNDAPKTIISKLLEVDELGYDAIILARGGGSFEDLFCFNDEQLVKTIYQLKTFIISGVGHEQDFTLTDFVSDLRAPTPTAAVEMITPDIADVIVRLDKLKEELDYQINQKINKTNMKLDYMFEKLIHYDSKIQLNIKHIDILVESIRNKTRNKITKQYHEIDRIVDNMRYRANLKLNNDKLLLKRLNTLLEAYAATNVLKRGYTLVLQNGKVVKKATELNNEPFSVRFIDATITAERKD